MANVKKITCDWSESGRTVYCMVRRETDSYRLNDSDGDFAISPADPYISLTEDLVIKGRYELSESRTAWDDGTYTTIVYKQIGASPSPSADTIIGSGEIYISSDSEVKIEDVILDIGALAALFTGIGSSSWSYTLTDSSTSLPIEGANIWVTTDANGSTVVASGYTNSSGSITFFLDAGTYYIWRQHASYTFVNPDIEVVT